MKQLSADTLALIADCSDQYATWQPQAFALAIMACGNFGRKTAIARIADSLLEFAQHSGKSTDRPWVAIATDLVSAIKITPAMRAKRAYRLHLLATVRECIRRAKRDVRRDNVRRYWAEKTAESVKLARISYVDRALNDMYNAVTPASIDRILASTDNLDAFFESGCCEDEDRANLSDEGRLSQAIYAYCYDLEHVADELGFGPNSAEDAREARRARKAA